MPSGNIHTYDVVGRKEDVANIISNISPTKVPLQSMIGSENIHNITHSWQEDSLQAPAQLAAVEGADAGTGTWQPTVMRSNNTQILSTVAQASGTVDVVSKYGRGKELSYQLANRSLELKRSLEYTLCGANTPATLGDNATARKMASFQAQLQNGQIYTAGAGGGLNFSGAAPSAGPITEAAVIAVCEQLYVNGSEPSICMIKPQDAKIVAGWKTAGRTQYIQNSDKAVYNVVDVYYTPFASEGMKFVINRFLRTSDALIFEPDMWKKLVLRNWFRETLAKTGDSTKVMILGEFSLKHKNYAASGMITNLS